MFLTSSGLRKAPRRPNKWAWKKSKNGSVDTKCQPWMRHSTKRYSSLSRSASRKYLRVWASVDATKCNEIDAALFMVLRFLTESVRWFTARVLTPHAKARYFETTWWTRIIYCCTREVVHITVPLLRRPRNIDPGAAPNFLLWLVLRGSRQRSTE